MAVVEARWDEDGFRRQLDRALEQVRKVLDAARNPQHPAKVPHRYDDKYLLAELATRTAVAALANAVASFAPAWDGQSGRLADWARDKVVTLSFTSEFSCQFNRTATRRVESETEHVVQSSLFGSFSSKTVTTVTEHFWDYAVSWRLAAYPGSDPAAEHLVLLCGGGRHEIKVVGPEPVAPRPERGTAPPIDVDISWLLRALAQDFSIARGAKRCHTPRRNPDVDAALLFFQRFREWAARVAGWLRGLFAQQTGHAFDLSCLSPDSVFPPVLPVFALECPGPEGAGGESAGPAPLPRGDCDRLLAEQQRTLRARHAAIAAVLPGESSGGLIGAVPAGLCMALEHADSICHQHACVLGELEDMLRRQLVAAIGKEVGPADFAEYMDFHNRRLFREEHRPRGFCYAVRRPGHYPEGVLSIESQQGEGAAPVRTFVAHSRAAGAMRFPLSAAAELSFYGDRYLHACMLHRFSGQTQAGLRLCARARQFSSYVLLVGKIAAADTFDPQAALIVQNKDDFTLPLLLETIPTPKEFRDAIESLSPEQQRFAKAFRAMQLASTMFGVVVIQIKPQLERLLRLSPGSLTKEVQLTQELMEMFIKYQFPSDLMAFDGDESAPSAAKVAFTKDCVARLRGMIAQARERELAEQAELERKRRMERPFFQTTSITTIGHAQECARFALPMPLSTGPGNTIGVSYDRAALARMQEECLRRQQEAQQQQQQQQQSAPRQEPAPQAEAPRGGEIVRIELRGDQEAGGGGGAAADAAAADYTAIPSALDQRFEALDEDAAVRPTIIKLGDTWRRSAQAGLISDPKETALGETEQRTERARAFDLLDALSRSGALPVEAAELHVVLAATHCFDDTLLNTVIQQNVNPIEKVERSCLILASTVQGVDARELIADQHIPRVAAHTPLLFGPAQ